MPTNNPLIAQATVIDQCSQQKVWEALTKPDLIKQYLFGTTVIDRLEGGQSDNLRRSVAG